MALDHAHGDNHPHGHTPANFGVAFALATALNLGFVVIGLVYGILSHSIALLADAGHNFGDVLALLAAWAAHVLGRRRPTARFTYGLGSASILAALTNAVVLLVVTGAVAWEAIRRFSEPVVAAGQTIMIVAGMGILINGGSAWLFAHGRNSDLNIKGAFLHLAGDAGVSAGVVVAGLLIAITGWSWLDPAASLLLCVVIIFTAWGLLFDSLKMSLAGVPSNIDPQAVRQFLETIPGVIRVHDLHIWPLSTSETALTGHLVMPSGHPGDEFILNITCQLENNFGIGHATLQIETSSDVVCALELHN